MDTVQVEIKNWEKYNAKRAQVTYSWLRLNNDIAHDPKLFGLTAGQKFFWVCLLCEASKKNNGSIEVDFEYYNDLLKLSTKELVDAIGVLEKKSIISTRCSVLHDATPDYTTLPLRTNERTNVPTSDSDESNTSEVRNSKPPPKEKLLHPLARLWNDKASSVFPRVREISSSSKRAKALRARWRECSDLEQWQRVIEFLNKSDFHKGGGTRGWVADFDFLLQPGRRENLLEKAEQKNTPQLVSIEEFMRNHDEK